MSATRIHVKSDRFTPNNAGHASIAGEASLFTELAENESAEFLREQSSETKYQRSPRPFSAPSACPELTQPRVHTISAIIG